MNEFYEKKHLFLHPFTALIAGSTGCGKTSFVMKILENMDENIKPKPDRVIYCYSIWQKCFDELKLRVPQIEFIEGLLDVKSLHVEQNNFVVLDDLMRESNENEQILDLFTKGSHHLNTSVLLLTQNLFGKGKNSRTISLNSQYIVIFNNPRDRSQITYLARQMFPKQPNFLVDAYEDATNQPHGYLFIDLKQQTENKLRVQTNVFDEKNRLFYVICRK
jgi:hypothetical protein